MQEAISFTPQVAASGIAQILWLIPAVPIVASGVIALLKQPKRRTAATLAIGSLGFSLLLAMAAFGHVLAGWSHGAAVRETVNFTWIQFGSTNVDLGWVLDPLSAVMLVMVTFVGLLIFIYSVGYMEHDDNFTRFYLLEREGRARRALGRACVALELPNEPGSLRDGLSAFADRGINLRSLVSRPSRTRAFSYRFYCEIDHVDGDRLESALAAVHGDTRIFGVY